MIEGVCIPVNLPMNVLMAPRYICCMEIVTADTPFSLKKYHI